MAERGSVYNTPVPRVASSAPSSSSATHSTPLTRQYHRPAAIHSPDWGLVVTSRGKRSAFLGAGFLGFRLWVFGLLGFPRLFSIFFLFHFKLSFGERGKKRLNRRTMPARRKVSKKAAPAVAAPATSTLTSFIISSGSDGETEGPYCTPFASACVRVCVRYASVC